MTSAAGQKTYWGLGEIVMWIRTRDHERVGTISDLSEEDAMVLAMFTDKARLSEQEAMVLAVVADKSRSDLRPLPGLTTTNPDDDRDTAAPQVHGKSSDIGEPIPMPPDQALDDLHRKVHSRRVPMTAIKCDGSSDEQIPVPPVDLHDLIFLVAPKHPVAPVGYGRYRGAIRWFGDRRSFCARMAFAYGRRETQKQLRFTVRSCAI
jgi:hypothetical protein